MLASLGTWKTISDLVSNVITIGAVAIGGGWAYWRFARERTRWPRARLELVVTHRELTADATLLNVTVKVHNAGVGLMRLTGLRLDVSRVLPLQGDTRGRLEARTLIPDDKVYAVWPCIAQAKQKWQAGKGPEIEPAENDEYIHDFLIPTSVQTVFVYGYLENEKRGRGAHALGWQVTTFYDLNEKTAERHVETAAPGG